MDTFEKTELTASVRHTERCHRSGIRIYNSESPGKEEEGEKEHKQLQSIMRFTPTQQVLGIC